MDEFNRKYFGSNRSFEFRADVDNIYSLMNLKG
jgi:hypothetical protein